MADFFIHNGELLQGGQDIRERASVACRSGEGLFETMRLYHGTIILQDYHFERLLRGMELLQLHLPVTYTPDHIKEQILNVCEANGNRAAARARLTAFRDDASSGNTDIIIESYELDEQYTLPEKGLNIGVYAAARKNTDPLSAYKTNYMLYAMAYAHALSYKIDDCLVMNAAGNICDAAIDNVFWIKNAEIFTPPLSEGCIAGVMRRHLLSSLPQHGYTVKEKPLTIELLQSADEIFLTNVIKGIRPVERCQGIQYETALTRKIFNELVAPLTRQA